MVLIDRYARVSLWTNSSNHKRRRVTAWSLAVALPSLLTLKRAIRTSPLQEIVACQKVQVLPLPDLMVTRFTPLNGSVRGCL